MILQNNSSYIAKERLKLMMESDTLEISVKDVSRLKTEISALISRYLNLPTDMFEVKITLKQEKKRV